MKYCTIITTSNHISKKELEFSKNNVHKFGFNKILDLTCHNKYLNMWAGTPDERLLNLHRAFNSDSDLIWACRGGSGIIQFLSKVNYKELKKKPKFFAGYSDLTPLLNMIYEKTKIISLHTSMCMFEQDEKTRNCFKHALEAKSYKLKFQSSINNKSNVSAIIKGGNLALCAWSLGQNFEIDFNNKIAFFEDVGTTEHDAFNRLVQLKNSKKFKPKAIVFGYLTKKNKKSCNMKIFKDMVKELFPNIPLIFGLKVGHQKPNFTIPIGAKVKIDFEKKHLLFKFPKSSIKYKLKFN